ncbi:MAG: preprotein translocase subunit SecE [Eggerthellaceae bacterium]|jgi:preprotein translocase subunit SecE|nr:preprotein translocase subunit SecE [Eggerthellaceae bacterium]
MAKKSKTQRAKASARRAEKKVAQQVDAAEDKQVKTEQPEEAKKGFFSKKTATSDAHTASQPKSNETHNKTSKKETKPAKKDNFFTQVRAELKRVTWPSKQEVLRWTGVVVVALVFFSVFVFVLDNYIVTPVLLGISSLGA